MKRPPTSSLQLPLWLPISAQQQPQPHAPQLSVTFRKGMRQLIDLLNSIAGSAARLPSGLPLPPNGSSPVPGFTRGSTRNGSSTSSSSSSSLRIAKDSSAASAVAAGRYSLPPPMSPAAAAALPVLRAAEAALEAKLANGAAACDIDYMQLHILNEQLGQEGLFRDAEARRELNRCAWAAAAAGAGGHASGWSRQGDGLFRVPELAAARPA